MPVPVRTLLIASLCACLALAACGGDDEDGGLGGQAVTTETRPERTQPPPAAGEPEQPRTAGPETETRPAPPAGEEQEGGAGDEEPIRSEAVFTGRGGRIAPSVVRVPSFIAVRIVLRSVDGGRYGLRVAGRALEVGPAKSRASANLPGLPSQDSYTARPSGTGNTVRIVASGEPGP